jgi:lipoprotein NlpD
MKQQPIRAARIRCCAVLLVTTFVFAGCTVRAVREAPIEDKSTASRTAKAAPSTAAAPTTSVPAPIVTQREASNGTYVVQRGDTLYSIAVAFGQDYRDIARWNNLDDPTKLAVGQALRVAPPEGDAGAAAVVGVVTVNPSAPTETRPLEAVPQAAPPAALPAPPATPAPPPSSPPATSPPPIATAPSTVPAPAPAPVEPATKPQPTERPTPPPQAAAGGAVMWQWPAKGKVIDGFNETRNKGIDIGGAEGEAVLAASDGDIVYVGSGLRMYGNLVIIKHNDDFISAYAHNKQILVKQGQPVRRGQRIADLGKTDDGQSKLHFEIRYRGKPVDPTKYLPAR